MNKATILIVDDKKNNIFAMENLLQKEDRIILSANNGDEALKIAFNKEIDLIILDVQMPGMDGFEVAKILKSNKRTKNIPMIFASAEKKDQQFMIKGLEEGAIDYLFKPLEPEVTKAKVAVLLKIQLQKKELMEKNSALEKYAILINNCSDIICTLDAETLKFEEVNNAITYILGYGIEEIKNSSLLFYLSNEDRVAVKNLSRQQKERLSFETSAYSKSREIKWLQWNVVVKYGKWFANARDITDVKEVEEIKNYLATVVKQSIDAIYLHDNEGKIISWNKGAEKIYGYTESEALKMKIWNIIPPYLLPEAQEIFNKIITRKKIESFEAKRITRNGKVIDVLFSASVVTDSDNNLKSIAINERDITEQKIADEKIRLLNADLQKNIRQLEIANKELESFSYSVSHDLRAPLRAISGFTKILEEDYGDRLDDEAKRLMANIVNNSNKMGLLIDDLLAFSRYGKKEISRMDISMRDLVNAVYKELIYQENKKNIELRVGGLASSEADAAMLKQVWLNLVSNAIKYSRTKTKPVIEIGCDAGQTENIYWVKDNGVGFDMQYSDKLFGVFQRLHNSDEFEGTGVGLAIVQRVIARHGGRVWAESKVGKGATFYFSLPKT